MISGEVWVCHQEVNQKDVGRDPTAAMVLGRRSQPDVSPRKWVTHTKPHSANIYSTTQHHDHVIHCRLVSCIMCQDEHSNCNRDLHWDKVVTVIRDLQVIYVLETGPNNWHIQHSSLKYSALLFTISNSEAHMVEQSTLQLMRPWKYIIKLFFYTRILKGMNNTFQLTPASVSLSNHLYSRLPV